MRVRQCFGSYSWRVNLSPGPSPLRGGEKFPPSLAGKGVGGLGRKGHILHGPLPWGPRPPGPPLCPPSWGLGSPTVWAPLVAGLRGLATRPSLVLWGHIPHAPCHGGLAPLDPHLPTPVGRGFAGVLGPTRGGVANVGDSPPLFLFWGHIPQTPWEGAAPYKCRFLSCWQIGKGRPGVRIEVP